LEFDVVNEYLSFLEIVLMRSQRAGMKSKLDAVNENFKFIDDNHHPGQQLQRR